MREVGWMPEVEVADTILELRVHGVSNTPPTSVLGADPFAAEPADGSDPPKAVRVAGNADTGFYRLAGRPAGPVTVEAYSWGQLTSGVRGVKDIQRAFWTLLLPFALVNVALHARPDVPPRVGDEKLTSAPGLQAYLVRLLGLSLTVTLVLGASGIGEDLVGWQCVSASCLDKIPGDWTFLTGTWWQQPGRPLLVGLLAPLAVLGLLGWLTRRSYQYEAELPAVAMPDDSAPGQSQPRNPLQQKAFWRGESQVRRLAIVHLSVGVAVALLVPVGAVVLMDPPRGWRIALAWPLLALIAAVLTVAAVALGHPWATRRWGDAPSGRFGAVLVSLTAVAFVATVVYLVLPDGPAGKAFAELRPPAVCIDRWDRDLCQPDRSLPFYDGFVSTLGTVQLLLLVALAGIARSGRRGGIPALVAAVLVFGRIWATGWVQVFWVGAVVALATVVTVLLPASTVVRDLRVDNPHARIVYGGRGPAVIAGLGWLLGLGYTAGALFWVANYLNRGATVTGRSAMKVPIPVTWSGALFAGAVLAGLLTVGWTLWRYSRLRRVCAGGVTAADERAHARRRARDVAKYQALHRLDGEEGLRIVGWLVAAGAVLSVVGAGGIWSGYRPAQPVASGVAAFFKGVTDVGGTLAGYLAFLIAGLGLLVYRSESVRRAVGVVWDLATFWPRAAHPLGPPCYAERAIPQLQTRTSGLLAGPFDRVLVSGHSQGAVISAATVLQMPADWLNRVDLFTYGCQLTRLYGRVFPAYFGPHRLPTLAALLSGPDRPRWTNFHRDTDPLGWPVDACEHQVEVRDPTALVPSGGEVNDPPIRNHSGYPLSAEYRDRVAVVAGARIEGDAPTDPGA